MDIGRTGKRGQQALEHQNKFIYVVENRVVVVILTFAASYGEFIKSNNIETYYMAASTEFSTTTAGKILLYFLMMFCAYVAVRKILSKLGSESLDTINTKRLFLARRRQVRTTY